MQSQFKKNFTLLQKSHPKLAYQILGVDPSNIEFCYDNHQLLNLKRDYEGQTYYYHSSTDIIKEAELWFSQLHLEQETVLFIYGVGLGYYYEIAKKWLHSNPQHALVFLEIDLGVIHRLLETKQGYEILKDSQVHLIHFSDPLSDKSTFNELAWNFVLSSFKFSSLKLYEELNPKGFEDLKHAISFNIVGKFLVVDEYLHYGIPFFRNFYPNLLELPKSYSGNELFNQFKNTPAIICGAGPSLNKNIDLLKNLTNRALIFAGSSALPALISKECIPHFGAAIDPNSTQQSRIEAIRKYDIPFFYRNRLFHDALNAISGKKLYLTGAGGYEVAEWFDQELQIKGEILDEGHNVINFCLAIAYALGCNPIILVGVDLAFTDQQHYAEGVASTLNLTEKDLQQKEDFDSQPIIREDINGKPVSTLWKWISESEWISEFAQKHEDVTIINSTEGGLGFPRVPNIPLKTVYKKYLSSSKDLYKLVQNKISEHPLKGVTQEKIIDLMKVFKQSLERSILYLDALINEMDRLLTNIKERIPIPETLETPETLLNEMAIQEEIGYQYLLSTFNLAYTKTKQRNIQSIQLSKKKNFSKVQQKKKILLQKERLNFLKEASQINIELINRTLKCNF